MKKIKLLLISILLFIPIFVYADAGAPMSSYYVRVTNQNGAPIYECENECTKTNNTLKYDTVVKVMYEEFHDKEMYLFTFNEKIDEEGGILKKEDVSPLEVDLSKYEKVTYNAKVYSFDEGNYLYEGPSKIYKKITPGVQLAKDTFYDVLYDDEFWSYIKVEDKYGWVFTGQGNRYINYSPTNAYSNVIEVNIDEPSKIITLEDIELYSSATKDTKLGVTIPKNTELDLYGIYSIEYRNKYTYLIKYNDEYSFIREKKQIFTKNSLDFEGNINFAYLCIPNDENNECKIDTLESTILYDNLDTLNEIKTINQSTYKYDYSIQVIYFGEWYHINDNGIKGWICKLSSDYSYNPEEEEEEPSSSKIDPLLKPPSINNNPNKEYNETKELVLYIIIGVLLLSLTAVVTIALINKKKDNKKNNDNSKTS